jgi:hypothetical protein
MTEGDQQRGDPPFAVVCHFRSSSSPPFGAPVLRYSRS